MNYLQRFVPCVIVQNRFKNTGKIGVDKHMQFFSVYSAVCDIFFIQKFVHAERVLQLPFNQPVGKINVAGSVRAAQKELELIEVCVNNTDKRLYRFRRNRPYFFRISRTETVKAFVRCRLVFGTDTIDRRLYQRRKKCFLVLAQSILYSMDVCES